ncbi:MAG: molybdopterin-dependent oxidoreductase [Methanoregula sp.]|jgi:DMSO/TMAO reductase YedYZ molybdopterin-dependent catalytic subunit|uniref:molybdopterin-dependent oxidoreductase n=1 Tax=Methanoregula sp. TaxID=2052170 RepID=UPI003D11C04F
MMKKQALVIFVSAAVLLGAFVVFVIQEQKSTLSPSAGSPTPLPGVEITSYEGRDLTAAESLPDNSIKGPQHINMTDYRLNITGLVNQSRSYTYDDVLGKYPQYTKLVTLHCVEGWDATILWEGVQVRDLVKDAGPDPRANTIVFTAADGYTTSFPLGYIMGRDIIMAYRMNNVTLPVNRGYPFQLVAEDKWGYKWIKWIEKIELTDDPGYRGYWEERGYSNSGDLNQSYVGA